MSARAICTLMLVLGAAAAAQADTTHLRRTVIVPVATSHEPAEARVAALVESALIEAARGSGVFELVNLENNRPRAPSRVDAKADPRPQARAAALVREHNAELAIVVEPQPLGDGAIVYLQILAPSGAARGSTTVALDAEALRAGGGALERPLRGGLLQIIAPERFIGRLELHIDVPGATIEVDGHRAASTGNVTTLPLSVGTHAVRVTNPAYHDYLRFIDVAFDRTRSENATLAAFPLTEGEMDERRRRTPVPRLRVPWYRSWWALALSGAVLTGATAGIVYGARHSINADETAHYRGAPMP